VTEFTFFAAIAVGFLGGTHCIGMCGGIVSALSLSIDQPQKTPLSFLLAYNLGRIISYVVAGAIAGGLGALLAANASLHSAQLGLSIVAAGFMFLMGLYIAGWSSVLSKVEKVGGVIWRQLEPLGRRFLPVKQTDHALWLGMVWGWLPCGLVYSVLIWSLSAGSATQGMWLMLGFGLGTLPNLLAMGVAAQQLKQWMHKSWVRQSAIHLLIAFAVIQLARLIQ
jgi:sulfite exporter TauE/SafE